MLLRQRVAVLARAVVLALAATALCSAASAHEIGKTQVVATIERDGTYTFDITVDPDALLLQLQLAAGDVTGLPVAAQDREHRLASLGGPFLRGVSITADGTSEVPFFHYAAPDPVANAASAIRLTGTLPAGAREVVFRYDWAGGTFPLVTHVAQAPPRTYWISPGAQSTPIALDAATVVAEDHWRVAGRYVWLGITHIVPGGLDHILFVVGLCLLRLRWRSIVSQISTFTLAHSITLALTAYGVVELPARVVEPLIAVSIAYVAIENLLSRDVRLSRTCLVFAFGLLHGMGFASVLREVGLPRGDLLLALVSFNGGVECGQLAVVAVVVSLCALPARDPARYRRLILQPSSLGIAAIALYWTVQRLL